MLISQQQPVPQHPCMCALLLTSCHLLPQYLVSDTVARLTALCITSLLVPPVAIWNHRAPVDVWIPHVKREQALQICSVRVS